MFPRWVGGQIKHNGETKQRELGLQENGIAAALLVRPMTTISLIIMSLYDGEA